MTKKTEKTEPTTLAVKEVDIKKKVSGAIKAATDINITTDEEMAEAGVTQVNIKQLQKYLTQEKKKQLDPANETVKAIKAFWAPLEIQVEDALAIISKALVQYHDKVEAERKKKEEKVIARQEEGKISEGTAVKKLEKIGEEKKTMHTGAGSVTFSKIKQIRVIDASKIPMHYLVPDMVRIRRDALEIAREKNVLGEVIPGIEVYEETNTNTRA